MAPIIDTTPSVNIALRFNPSQRNVFPMQGMLRSPSLCHICRRWPSQPLCASCVERFAQPKCHNCAKHPSPLDACVAAVSYTFPWADCIARFKFQADPSLARALAHLMRHAPWVEPALNAATLVVPSHPRACVNAALTKP